MPNLGKIRDNGIIPERRHDAFLLALLLAMALNIAFFAAQALIPRLAYLLQVLGADPALTVVEEEEEEAYPFVLVDPSLLDDEPDPLFEAESNVTRRARQEEARSDLPELAPTIMEGVDEILTAPDGNPGPAVSYQQSPGEQSPQSAPAEQPQETPEAAEPSDPSEPLEAIAPLEPMEPVPPPEEAPAEPPPAETEPLPEEMPEIPEPPEPSPDSPEAPPEPMEDSEEPAEEPPVDETLPEDTVDEEPQSEEPSPDDSPEPMADMVDLAALPMTNEGFFDPETERLQELARQRYTVPPQPARPQSREPTEPRPPVPQTMAQEPRPRRDRTGRPQPQFKRLPSTSPATQSVTGGAPPRRRQDSAVRVLDADASMALLTHRYGEYMEKLARQLQDSLFRQMILSPTAYSRGQVKIRFGISPDGTLTYYTTTFPNDGSMDLERILSERMLREAAPFDPLTPEMQQDDNFQRMTVIVHLY